MKHTNNKKIPKAIENEVLKVLSLYPELQNTRIDFVLKKNMKNHFMHAQPKISTMFGPKKNRIYVISVSDTFKFSNPPIQTTKIEKEVLVGWLGHELGHVMDYENHNLFGMICFGLGYLFSAKYKRSAEKRADIYALQHGLKEYILFIKRFSLTAGFSEKYKRKISNFYLSYNEILLQLEAVEKSPKDF